MSTGRPREPCRRASPATVSAGGDLKNHLIARKPTNATASSCGTLIDVIAVVVVDDMIALDRGLTGMVERCTGDEDVRYGCGIMLRTVQ